MAHKPAEGSLHNPPTRQDGETRCFGRAFDYFHLQLGFEPTNPLGKLRPTVSAIDPQSPQPCEPAQRSTEQGLRSLALGNMGPSHQDSQHQAQRIYEQVALASGDLLGRIVSDWSPVPIGFDTLAVQNGGRGTTALAFLLPGQGTQACIDGFPSVIESPFSEDGMNGIERFSPPEQASHKMASSPFAAQVKLFRVLADRFEFESPFGILGRMVDRLLLFGYMRRFLVRRNEVLKNLAEAEEWRKYFSDA